MFTLELTEEEKTALLKAMVYRINVFNDELDTYGIDSIKLPTVPPSLLALSQYGALIRGLTTETTAVKIEEDAKSYDNTLGEHKHTVDLRIINEAIEDFVYDDLKEYSKRTGEDIDWIIVEACQSLTLSHPYELNLIITHLVSGLNGRVDGTEETEEEIIKDFNKEWFTRGLPLD